MTHFTALFLDKAWAEHKDCQGCPNRVEFPASDNDPGEYFCSANKASDCPAIPELIEDYVDATFSPDEQIWLSTHNLFDYEAIAELAYADEFGTSCANAQSVFANWRALQYFKESLK